MHKIRSTFSWHLLLLTAAVLVLLVGATMTQCSDSSSDDGDGDTTLIDCLSHVDCPVKYSCTPADGVCGEDPNAISCYDLADCTAGYCCFVDATSEDGSGKCVPDDGSVSCEGDGDGDDSDGDDGGIPSFCKTDTDCGNPAYVCCFNKCEEKNGACQDTRDCLPGQYCQDDFCQGDPVCEIGVDGDEDKATDADLDPELEAEVEPEQQSGCERTSDCGADEVCGPGGECVPRCDAAGAAECPDPQHCNPNNGYCECCETMCAPGQCCNRAEGGFWYCGQCCSPPCANGQACQGGTCAPIVCPTCEATETCSATTCWECEGEPPPDGDTEGTKSACLPANSACEEGVDNCCSGTCMMGTCL